MPLVSGTGPNPRAKHPGMILEVTDEAIIHIDLRWTQTMPSHSMAARVGQIFIGHFPTGVYQHKFGHLLSPLCEGCRILDTRAQMLLDCTDWVFQREQLREWL